MVSIKPKKKIVKTTEMLAYEECAKIAKEFKAWYANELKNKKDSDCGCDRLLEGCEMAASKIAEKIEYRLNRMMAKHDG